MDTIKSYIEQMFQDLPKTKEVVEMKLNILDNMEDKFNDLINDGKTEAEASRIVISDFGDMDEILEELNIDVDVEKVKSEGNHLDEQEVKELVSWKKRFASLIGIGVGFCIEAIAVSALLSYYLDQRELFSTEMEDIILPIVFFPLIAIGVAVIVYAGMKNQKYEDMLKMHILDSSSRQWVKTQEEQQKTNNIITLIVGIVFCIAAITTYTLFEIVWNSGMAQLIFFNFIIVGVFLIISSGVRMDTYSNLLNPKTKKDKEVNKKVEIITSVIMMGATIVFLLAGFLFHAWKIAWIVFPICGIGCGIVSTIYGGTDDSRN